jgi:hypothetical protein
MNINLDQANIEKVKTFLKSEKGFLYSILGLCAVCLMIGFTVGRVSKADAPPEKIVQYDTVYRDQPVMLGGTITKIEVDEEVVDTRPLPALTKFKVTDWVCAWGKWTGVIRNIHYSERNPKSNVLVYEVQHYNETDNEWYESGYYETELELGKCN